MGNVFSCSGGAGGAIASCCTCCWNECFREQVMYMCNLEENLKALKSNLEELKAKRNDVMTKVNLAEQQQRKRTEEVQDWLSKVVAMETKVAELIRDEPQELCLGGCCSKKCKFTYEFGKGVAQKLKEVVDLKNKKFEEVAGEVLADPVEEIPIEPTVGLESTFENVWSCLQDNQVGIVGLHGTGGVGKTTLLKQINNKFFDTHNNFDIVIWVVVSRDLKLEKVQEDIGGNIGFSDDKWKCKSFDQKAKDIFKVLKQKKFVLFLDDIWERIDLTKVGIPDPNIQNGSKLVFTTRSEHVCHLMKAQKKIRVECLAWEKAWELFQEKVGKETLGAHPNIPKLAMTVAQKCGGLPLALITVGRAMAGKRTHQQWEHAIEVLRRNASEISGMKNEVFAILKFSYYHLRNDKVRYCFLYCALFPEDFSINKKDLVDYWIAEVFLDGYDDRSKAENEGNDLIDTLVQASLMEEGGNYVKMHDVIRDLALWIASECGKVEDNYMVEAGARLIEAPDVEKWERVRRVSLMTNQIENLTKTPKCPNLLTLFLCENHLKVIASEFFQFMPSLRVLDLSLNKDLEELPPGISKLISLEQQLPYELKTLVKLRYLNLEHLWNLKRIPHQLISSFSKLEVLRMFRCGNSVEALEENILSNGNNELLVEELSCLKHLNTLSMDIKSDSGLYRFLSLQKLLSCAQKLTLSNLSLEQLNVSSLANRKRLEVFFIEDCKRLQELKIEWASEGREIQVPDDLYNSLILSERCFDSLHTVYACNCWELRDLTWLILAPNLTYLCVQGCFKMEEIISVGKLGEVLKVAGNLNPFAKLEMLNLDNLQELKSIYRSALSFPHLNYIWVDRCPKLKKLPLSNTEKERKIVIKGNKHWWKELEWEDEATKKAFLPCFNDI